MVEGRMDAVTSPRPCWTSHSLFSFLNRLWVEDGEWTRTNYLQMCWNTLTLILVPACGLWRTSCWRLAVFDDFAVLHVSKYLVYVSELKAQY